MIYDTSMESLGFFVLTIFLSTQAKAIQALLLGNPKMKFVAFTVDEMKDTLVVDCSHPTATQLTHHLKYQGQKDRMDMTLRGDSSTDAVLNAIVRNHNVLNKKFVSSNHWDIDSFLSVWCSIYRDTARTHENVLRDCAKIGDFRELRLDESWQHTALQLACWLNSEERRLFYRPFESAISRNTGEDDGDLKFDYFLNTFENVVLDTLNPAYQSQWIEEYNRVVKEYKEVNSGIDSTVSKYDQLGLVVVEYPNPMHYYSLFSTSLGYDIVLACYSDNRYELELKYTSHVDLSSRPVYPKVELQVLAEVLNSRESALSSMLGIPIEHAWSGNRITDSGPILRLDKTDKKLNKIERYGHPYERPIYSSLIPKSEIIETVVAYFQHAYRGSTQCHRKFDWEWSELHDFNRAIDWSKFKQRH